jgi:hypothetical protein
MMVRLVPRSLEPGGYGTGREHDAATARARRAASGTERSTGLPPLAQAIKIQAEAFAC